MGRSRRRSAAEWQALISAQRESGETIEAFCAAQGVGDSTFGKWKRRLAGVSRTAVDLQAAAPVPSLFTPLTLPSAATPAPSQSTGGWAVELDLGGGVCLRLRPA